MKIIQDYPPNIELIRLSDLNPTEANLFCYGDTIYNPSGKNISPDIEYHETIHQKQQEDIGVDNWWYNYITDRDFRLKQEIEAYGEQYKFAKEKVKNRKLIEWLLDNIASALSGQEYGNLVSYGEAESKIRNYAK